VCGARSVLVVGSKWQGVFDACAPLAGFLVRNPGWRSGIGGSIALGAGAVRHVAEAAVIMLADQPLVTAEHLAALIARWQRAPGTIVATAFAGVLGPPALFPGACLEQLAGLSGDRGARSVIGRAGARVEGVAFEPAAVDVDRPEDLRRLP
jgi:molybdenum cofactor cytidylyltransferase